MGAGFRSKKRNRPSFVCTNCRKKKIKCDKQNPCHNCVKSDNADSCRYLVPKISHVGVYDVSKDSSNSVCNTNTNPEGYENLVWKLQQQQPPPPPPHISQNNDISNSILLKQLEQLKLQISGLEGKTNGNPTSVSTVSDDSVPVSILDLRINALKLFTIVKKQSRTYVQGPLSFLSCSFAAFVSPVSSNILLNFFNKERDAWKSINGPSTDLGLLINSSPSLKNVVSKIREVMTKSNFDAIKERLHYFQNNLNYLLYNGFVDMPHVLETLNSFFKITDDGEVIFLEPQKTYKYADLSLIFSLTESVLLFTRDDINSSFRNKIDTFTKSRIYELATETLALSNFRRKESFAALISMLLLRDNRYEFAELAVDSMDQTKSSYIVKECILLAIQLGLHRDTSAIKGFVYKKCSETTVYHFPLENSSILWSHLKSLDAYYSSYLGTPLMISEMFCDSAAPSTLDSDIAIIFTNLQREASILLNSVNKISLNEIINIRKKFINFNLSIGSFKSLLFQSETNTKIIDSIAQKLSIKIRAFTFVSVLNSYLWIMFTNTSIFPTDQLTMGNIELMKQYAKFFEFEYARSNFLSWGIITALITENTVFRDNTSKYLVYLKTESLHLLYTAVFMFGISSACHYGFFQSTVRSSFLIGNSIECDPIRVEDLDLDEVELSLGSEPRDIDEFPNILDARLLELIKNPKQSAKFLSEMHHSISKVKILTQNYGYFCILKLISIFCCFSNAITKFRGDLRTGDRMSLNQVLEKTRNSIEASMKLGIVDMGFSLPNDEETIKNWLDAFFDQVTDLNSMELETFNLEVSQSGGNNTMHSPAPLACFFYESNTTKDYS